LIAIAPAQDGVRRFATGAELPQGAAIDFFGDSITWQGGHVDRLQAAVGAARPQLGITLHKRGLNGGKSTDLLAGAKELYGTSQAPFAAVLAADHPAAAVIQIGINDVWQRDHGTTREVFATTLRALCDAAAVANVPVILCTPTVIGERKGGANEFDRGLDDYAATVRSVAAAAHVRLCDLRAAFGRELASRNTDDTEHGTLTYDGVHLNDAGNDVLADCLGAALAAEFAGDGEAATAALASNGALPLVPWPRQLQRGDGALRLSAGGRVAIADAGLHAVAAALPLDRLLGRRVAITSDAPAAGDVALALDPSLPLGGYRLDVADMVRIAGRDAAAVAHGAATLLQLVVLSKDGASVPRLAIRDAPDCAYRGLLIDVARQPHPVAGLEQLVELCRAYKIDYLQLHLTDDQAFTFPSTAFAAAVTKGHSYTVDELRRLDDYAAARGVTVVPELDVPGHCGALIAALPALFRAHSKHHATINFANPAVVDAVDTLIGEILAVFTHTPYMHVGGDECDLEHVAESADFQAAFAREQVTDAEELYRRFLVQLRERVQARGKQMIVWEGFGPSGTVAIPKDIVVMPFESLYHLPDQLVASGYPVINASWQPLYVVNDRCWPPAQIYGWHVRRYEHFVAGYPAFKGIEVPASPLLLGAQLCAWEQPAARELPSLRRRLPALAERVWCERNGRDVDDFLRRLQVADARLARLLR
jgi:hexosaminidase